MGEWGRNRRRTGGPHYPSPDLTSRFLDLDAETRRGDRVPRDGGTGGCQTGGWVGTIEVGPETGPNDPRLGDSPHTSDVSGLGQDIGVLPIEDDHTSWATVPTFGSRLGRGRPFGKSQTSRTGDETKQARGSLQGGGRGKRKRRKQESLTFGSGRDVAGQRETNR